MTASRSRLRYCSFRFFREGYRPPLRRHIDASEMGNYEFRSRLEADMSIAAVGFQNATPVRDDLVGKPARCIEYDCQQEQATVLQFSVFSGGL